jgi:hypothetical protein
MEGIIGRIQSEADANGKRNDIQLETNVFAIKTKEGEESMASMIENMGLGAVMSDTKPTHSAIWIMPED